jgi:hypothetical protein
MAVLSNNGQASPYALMAVLQHHNGLASPCALIAVLQHHNGLSSPYALMAVLQHHNGQASPYVFTLTSLFISANFHRMHFFVLFTAYL